MATHPTGGAAPRMGKDQDCDGLRDRRRAREVERTALMTYSSRTLLPGQIFLPIYRRVTYLVKEG